MRDNGRIPVRRVRCVGCAVCRFGARLLCWVIWFLCFEMILWVRVVVCDMCVVVFILFEVFFCFLTSFVMFDAVPNIFTDS